MTKSPMIPANSPAMFSLFSISQLGVRAPNILTQFINSQSTCPCNPATQSRDVAAPIRDFRWGYHSLSAGRTHPRAAPRAIECVTEDIGHPKLREHLASVTTIMKLSDEYDDFGVKLDRIHPRYDETLALPLLDKDGDPA